VRRRLSTPANRYFGTSTLEEKRSREMLMLAISPVALCCLSVTATAPQTLTVIDDTDAMTHISGNKVKVVQGTSSSTRLTNAVGTTTPFSVDLSAPMEVWLKQKATPAGLCLGQARVLPPVTLGSGENIRVVNLFQPLAEPLVLDSEDEFGAAPYGAESSHNDRWYITPFEESNYNFPAQVGILMTSGDIAALFSYYGVPLQHSDCTLGLVISVDDPEPVGSPGFEIEFRVDSYGFQDLPGVDVYHLAYNQQDLISPGSLDVSPGLWQPQRERAAYTVSGLLGKGLNVVLLRPPGEFSTSSSYPVTLPVYPPVTTGGAYPAANPDCTPCPPSGSQTSCPVDTPMDDSGCPPSGCNPPTECESEYTALSGLSACSDGGGSSIPIHANVTISVSGGVSVPVSINGSPVTFSVGLGAEVSLGVDVIPGDGQGCGQCVQAFIRKTTCKKTCTVHEDRNCKRLFGIFRACCHDKKRTKKCVDLGVSLSACNKSGTAPNGSTCPGDPPCGG
jgi:hypothetical protein